MQIILGAGLSGLSCALHLQTGCKNNDILMLEKESVVGGLCRSYQKEGFTFDYTGHWIHLNDEYCRRFLHDAVPDLLEIERNSIIWSQGRYTAYPYQINTYGLPAETIVECLEGFVDTLRIQEKEDEKDKSN